MQATLEAECWCYLRLYLRFNLQLYLELYLHLIFIFISAQSLLCLQSLVGRWHNLHVFGSLHLQLGWLSCAGDMVAWNAASSGVKRGGVQVIVQS